ncbi:MAG: Gx transporter family protein [Clostridia bacterium]|nr:Gx transporter family protein [Clostridia bacterium]
MSDKVRKICLWAILALLSASLSLLERPLMALIPLPLPGFKLGLGNVCVLFCLYRLGKADAVIVYGLRIALTALLFGSPTSFALSFGGAVAALTGAFLAIRVPRLTPVGVSVTASSCHMVGQICVASLILKTPGLFVSYLPMLLILSVPTGILNGAIASVLISRIPQKLTQTHRR